MKTYFCYKNNLEGLETKLTGDSAVADEFQVVFTRHVLGLISNIGEWHDSGQMGPKCLCEYVRTLK